MYIYIYKYYSPKVPLSRGLNGDHWESTALCAPFPNPGWRFQELRRLQRAWKAMVASNLSRLGDVWGAESDSQSRVSRPPFSDIHWAQGFTVYSSLVWVHWSQTGVVKENQSDSLQQAEPSLFMRYWFDGLNILYLLTCPNQRLRYAALFERHCGEHRKDHQMLGWRMMNLEWHADDPLNSVDLQGIHYCCHWMPSDWQWILWSLGLFGPPRRCMRKGKFDPLDMKTWYPVCGEPYEVETACAVLRFLQIESRGWSEVELGFNRFPFLCWMQQFWTGAVSLLKEVDVRCRAQLDSAADAVGHGQVGGGNFSESYYMGHGLEWGIPWIAMVFRKRTAKIWSFSGSDILTSTSYVDPLVFPLSFACRHPRLLHGTFGMSW